jgi:LPXTG-motif cell wall-anchored protein
MTYIKSNLAAITGLLVMAFFIYQNYHRSISERSNATPVYIGSFTILLILLILIYFKKRKKKN